MLNENIKKIREKSGLTQEAFAIRLNVVRQTVSKWEKGQSVPDAEIIQRIAEEFHVPVQEILGSGISQDVGSDMAVQLAKINEQLASEGKRKNNVWKILSLVLAAALIFSLGVFFGKMLFPSQSVMDELSSVRISDFHMVASSSEKYASFFTNSANSRIEYVLVLHDKAGGDSDITVKATNKNGICEAQIPQIRENHCYSIILHISSDHETRYFPVAYDFSYSENSSICTYSEEYLNQ